MTPCTPSKKSRMLLLDDQGKMARSIATEVGMSASQVRKIMPGLRESRDPYAVKPKPGRPRKLDERDLRRARREIKSGRAPDATALQRDMFPDVSPRTVQRNLCEIGLPGRVRRKKPYLSKKHRKSRREWVKEQEGKDLEDWQRIWYSDESKFNLFGSDGRRWCRREIGEELCDRCVDVQVKHGGGNVMVWGDISWNGVGRLHRIEGTMDAVQYCKILSHSLLGSLSDQKTAPSSIIFQQDNDSKHKSRMATRWFEDHDITVLPWPSSSPDMNLIEHVWDVLDRKLRARPTKPSNRDQLWEILQEEWESIDVETIRDLYRSIPRRLEALKKARGGYTKY
ncbi:transposable element Tcb2 transposase [Phanerochaete sordida]|uniref:Transposable element Tcb2 transposase n=1 Tax=Phanerochaete sordida TaxID=48140 RepID=A0A9P3LJS9_9APHY|nr:transposable element Tcb2 transposase [Phanerochaete sordida]